MDKYEEMKTFVQIVESGGISHAANQLNIAKSAVSRRLNDLELRLSVRLFNRSTRKFNLTDTGNAYYQQCIRLLNDLAEVESLVTRENKVLKGKLRITVPLSFGLGHLGKVIYGFIKEHPEIQIDIDLNDREINLIEDNYDLSLRIGVLEDSQLIARKLFELNLIPVASPNFIKKYGMPKTPHELEKLPMIDYTLSSDYLSFSNKKGHSARIKPHIIHSCSNGDFIAEMVSYDLGFSILPSFIVYQYIENKKLQPLLTDYNWGNEHAYAVYPSTRHLSSRVRTFVDYLVEYFEGVPYWDKFFDSIST